MYYFTYIVYCCDIFQPCYSKILSLAIMSRFCNKLWTNCKSSPQIGSQSVQPVVASPGGWSSHETLSPATIPNPIIQLQSGTMVSQVIVRGFGYSVLQSSSYSSPVFLPSTPRSLMWSFYSWLELSRFQLGNSSRHCAPPLMSLWTTSTEHFTVPLVGARQFHGQ